MGLSSPIAPAVNGMDQQPPDACRLDPFLVCGLGGLGQHRCPPSMTRQLIAQLLGILPYPLYHHQGLRLVR